MKKRFSWPCTPTINDQHMGIIEEVYTAVIRPMAYQTAWHTTAYINFSVILKQNDSVIFVSLAKKIIFWQIKPFFLETLVYAGLRWFMICSNLRLGKDLKGQMVELEVDKGSRMCIFLCMFICLLYLYVNVLLMYLQVCFYLHLTQLLMWPNQRVGKRSGD